MRKADKPRRRRGSAPLNPEPSTFEEVGKGILRASAPEANGGDGADGNALHRIRAALFGRPIATAEEPRQRVGASRALPILASDNMSSSAYATEELTRVLVLAGAGALALTMPLSITLVCVLVVVVFSYSQVIRAYPHGGGSYASARENLGVLPGLIAAASLIVDYILTVAVSVAAGVAAMISAMPGLVPFRVPVALLFVAVLAVGNLRGVRESARVFSIPTYLYILTMASLIVYGLVRYIGGTMPEYQAPPDWAPEGTEVLGLLLILRAFSSGAVALTGVEAVSNGMRILRPPEARNARVTLIWMAVLFGSIFLGISFLASKAGIVPDPAEEQTVISQLARLVAGDGAFHILVQAATALILILAANTAFVDFPRLSSVLARDRFFPRQFLFRGRRLAFSVGILAVGALAATFIVAFRGSVAALIPLYTVGVFVAFSLSQAGMVIHWRRKKGPWWRGAMAVNALGAIVTGVVAVESAAVKFTHGAWFVLLLVPVLVLIMLGVRRHYTRLGKEIRLEHDKPLPRMTRPHLVLVPVADLNKPVAAALAYARSLSDDVRAVNVTDDIKLTKRLRDRWEKLARGVPLVTIETPTRDWIGSLMRYIEAERKQHENAPVTVVVPEFVPRHWWEHLLHSQSALRLKFELLSEPQVVVVSVPYQLRT